MPPEPRCWRRSCQASSADGDCGIDHPHRTHVLLLPDRQLLRGHLPVLDVGYVSSTNGGASWTASSMLAGPMTLSWLPNTSQGRMFGDYISTSVMTGRNAFAALPEAGAPSGSTFNQAMFVPTGGLAVTDGSLRPAVAEGAQPQASPTQTTNSPTAN